MTAQPDVEPEEGGDEGLYSASLFALQLRHFASLSLDPGTIEEMISLIPISFRSIILDRAL